MSSIGAVAHENFLRFKFSAGELEHWGRLRSLFVATTRPLGVLVATGHQDSCAFAGIGHIGEYQTRKMPTSQLAGIDVLGVEYV
jgi:hypothetical protein